MPQIIKYIVVPTVLLLAATAIGLWILLPLWSEIQSASGLKVESENNLIQKKAVAANLNRLMEQYRERAADFDLLNKAIPSGKNIPELLINLEALASENGMAFLGVEFKASDEKGAGVKILPMAIRVKGSYTAFQEYVKSVEQSLRLLDVVNASFDGIAPGQSNADPGAINFNLLVNAYFQ